ncbi:MAG: class II fructose-bisphosphatase [Rhodospirillales bacterium]|jgi:fructose-1,6-bisphosphatase II|nr:class II fructose-bisphosphatase [Rhodospirillales bacterium]MDP7216037.1 class II fructose-bisphosphatase [Rhodospirillales bacterium]HJP53117.1 class II fructose-bisphosphatase [Rhodospirillales bacterium]
MNATQSMPGDLYAGPVLVYALRKVTEAAARSAYQWIGRGDRGKGDRAAVKAMYEELAKLPISGTVIVGGGADEKGGNLNTGERVGALGGEREFDIAVDPVEGITYVAKGMTNAMAVICLTPKGTLFDPAPAFYMEKFAAAPAAKGRIDPAAPVESKLAELAKALAKPVSELTVFVLEKPRHRELVERIHRAGARVALYPAGDVAGALMAAIPNSGIDALMGTGGTREGLISACAIRAMDGEFSGRFDPQLATETAAAAKAGVDTSTWYAVEDLVRSDEVYFSATGITTGLLFEGVERSSEHESTQSLLIAGPSGERQILTTFHRRESQGKQQT